MKRIFRKKESQIIELISKEFLEERLGIATTPENISLFSRYIAQFEQEVVSKSISNSLIDRRKSQILAVSSDSIEVKVRGKCHA